MFRKIVFKEWKSFDDAFYSAPPYSTFRASYWFWLIQGFGNEPKLCITVPIIRTKNYLLNGVPISCKKLGKNKFEVGVFIWYFKNNKQHILLSEQGIAIINPKNKKISISTKSGYKIIMNKSLPHYKLTISKNNKKIGEFKSISSAVKGKFRSENPETTPAKFTFSEKGDSVIAFLNFYKFPMACKEVDLFSKINGSFMGTKLNGSSWAERLCGFFVYVPWKYLLIDSENNLRFSAVWYYHKTLDLNHPKNIFIDYNGKRYNLNLKKYDYYTNLKGNPYLDLRKNTKYIKLEGKTGDMKVNMTVKIIADFLSKYDVLKIEGHYHQFLLKILDFSFEIGKKKIRLKDLGKYSAYGEHSYLHKKFGYTKRKKY